jgi:uncharacterized protein (TIRG00374 family)
MNGNVKKVLRWVVTLAVLFFIVAFARTVDWGGAWRSIRSASPAMLLAAAAVNIASILIKGARWWIFLRPMGISLGLSMRATLAGAGLNNVLVANGGDAARIVFVSRAARVPSATVLASLALERMFDAVGYVALLVSAAVLLPLPRDLERWRVPAECALAVMVLGLVLLVRQKGGAETLAAETAMAGGVANENFLRRAGGYFKRFGRSVAVLSTGPRFVGAFALSLVAWALQAATFHLTALAAHATVDAGQPLPPTASVAALLLVNAGLLIRATPGNVGVFQLLYSLAVTQFGMARETAIGVSLLIQTLQILPITALGVLLAPEFVFKRHKDAAVAASEPAREPAATPGSVPPVA